MTSTSNARDHYQSLLAPLYEWMIGGLDSAVARSAAELGELGIVPPAPGQRALDLGAGLGVTSIALRNLGYAVTAVDSSSELLSQLSARDAEVTAVHCDMRETTAHVGQSDWDLIVCTGDTLTHLDTNDDVRDVLSNAAAMLSDTGRLLLTLRDYVSDVPADSERWIVARSDPTRMLTCHLVYRPDSVKVTDIVHEWEAGVVQVRASTYTKRRLAPAALVEMLRVAGLVVTHDASGHGWIRLVASKRAK